VAAVVVAAGRLTFVPKSCHWVGVYVLWESFLGYNDLVLFLIGWLHVYDPLRPFSVCSLSLSIC